MNEDRFRDIFLSFIIVIGLLVALFCSIGLYVVIKPSQSTPVTRSGTMQFQGVDYSYTCHGNICEGLKVTPTSTDTLDSDLPMHDDPRLYSTSTITLQVNPTSTPQLKTWSCPAIELCKALLGEHCAGVMGVQTFILEIHTDQTPQSVGYNDCTHKTNEPIYR